MSTRSSVVEFLVAQFGGGVTAKRMFGEYGLFLNGVMFGLVCNEQLFIKKTEAGASLVRGGEEASPYDGAKPAFLIHEERWAERPWLLQLAKATSNELPRPRTRASVKPTKLNLSLEVKAKSRRGRRST